MILLEFLSDLIGVSSREQWEELISDKNHTQPIKHHRALILSKRVSLFALLFAILIPSWTVIDYLTLPTDLWLQLAVLRIISGLIFLRIYTRCNNKECSINKTLWCLNLLLFTPTIFFLIADPIIHNYTFSGLTDALVSIYSLLPLMVIASLTIFALTIKELIFIIVPVSSVALWSYFPDSTEQLTTAVTFSWLLLLLVLTSSFSSVSQMRYMISQVSHAAYDSLTSAMTRRAGIETLDVVLRLAQLQTQPMSVLFLDLDQFKSLNDDYGHDAGDQALIESTKKMKTYTRKGDFVIRWGGEEFLILLPQSSIIDATIVINRILNNGLGQRPDGAALTASIGVAEIIQDKTENWKQLVELADQRMYYAKTQGRARCFGPDERLLGTFSNK